MTIAEVAVVVAVASILLGVATSLLFGLRDWDRNARQRGMQNDQLMRLAETIRSDIRHGADVSAPTEQTLLIHSPGEKRTQYELTPEGCHRVVTLPNEAKTLADLFAIGPATSWSLDSGAPGARPIFVVTINRTSADNEQRAAPLLVQATLGADLTTPTPAVIPRSSEESGQTPRRTSG